MEWYRKVAKRGYADAEFNLGVMYEKGWGVEKNESTAVEWYRKAAEQGHPSAQLHLGVMYEKGCGVDKNESIAVEWYRKVARKRYADAAADAQCYLDRLTKSLRKRKKPRDV